MKPRLSAYVAVSTVLLLPLIAFGAACKVPSAGASASLRPGAVVDATLVVGADASLTGDAGASRRSEVVADVPVDPCATLFTGPHYDVPRQDRPKRRLGQPATLLGANSALCGSGAACSVSMLLPAGRDDETGEDWFVSRVDSAAHTSYEGTGCGMYVDYFLVVAQKGKISRLQYLVETGETCMHWRGEQVTVGPNLFIWRDSGYGSPIDAESYKAWEHRHVSIELSTLRVNGCVPPPSALRGPLIPHPFG